MRPTLAIGFAFLSLGVAGCSFLKAPPECSKQPNQEKLSTPEKAALADARDRYLKGCTRKGNQCQIEIGKNVKGDIFVTFSSVHPDRASGQCLQTPGDYSLGAYNPEGKFVGSGMSL